MRIFMFLLAFMAIPGVLLANPVIYQDGKMLDIITDSKSTDIQLFYSLTSRMSAGYRYVSQVSEPDPVHLIQGNFLVNRWNEPDSQANIYVMAGFGTQSQSLAGYVGAETDWENRVYYIAASSEQFLGKSSSNKSVLRMGFAPYVAEYDELHTWLILQATQMTGSPTSQWIVPIIRLFKDNILVELGTNGSFHTGTFRIHF
jgi:hypothetical protein